MPIEIKELMIDVKVANTSNQATTASSASQSEVIEACMDQVMTVINSSKER